MSNPSPDHQALFDHLVTRIRSDIDFLSSQQLIPSTDAELIKSKLPSHVQLTRTNTSTTTNAFGAMTLHDSGVGAPMETRNAAHLAGGRRATCKAVWDYPPSQPDDLGFVKGDIITIDQELNQDWWKGSIGGRSGIFPSNHVERIPFDPSASPPSQYPQSTGGAMSPSSAYTQPQQTGWSQQSFVPPPPSQQPQYAYQQPQHYTSSSASSPFVPPPPHASHQSPTPGQGWGEEKKQPLASSNDPYPHQGYQPPSNPTVLASPQQQQQPPPVPKKKFGKLGGQMGTAFAGGIGFGTGTALASNAINAIF